MKVPRVTERVYESDGIQTLKADRALILLPKLYFCINSHLIGDRHVI